MPAALFPLTLATCQPGGPVVDGQWRRPGGAGRAGDVAGEHQKQEYLFSERKKEGIPMNRSHPSWMKTGRAAIRKTVPNGSTFGYSGKEVGKIHLPYKFWIAPKDECKLRIVPDRLVVSSLYHDLMI